MRLPVLDAFNIILEIDQMGKERKKKRFFFFLSFAHALCIGCEHESWHDSESDTAEINIGYYLLGAIDHFLLDFFEMHN